MLELLLFFIVGIAWGIGCYIFGFKAGKAKSINNLMIDLTSAKFTDSLLEESELQTAKGTKKDAFLKGANYVTLNIADGNLMDDIK